MSESIFLFLIKRSMVWYLCLFFVMWFLIDYKTIEMGDKIKTNFYENPQIFKEFVLFAGEGRGLNAHQWQDFINYYEQFIKSFPKSADAYMMLGFCYYHLGQEAKAIAAYQKASVLAPDVLWPYYNLGVIYFKKGNYPRAIFYLKQAVQKEPPATLELIHRSKRIYLPIATAANINLSNLKRQIKEGYRDSYLLIAASLARLNQFEDLLRISKRALISQLGYEALFYFYIGLAQYQLKHFDQAISAFKQCIALSRDHDQAFYYRGLSLEALGQDKGAKESFQEAQLLRAMKGNYPAKEDQIDLRIY